MAYFQSNVEKREYNTKPEEYRLYVANIPMELDEDGIQQIFKHYGTVSGLFCLPNTSWAYVTYKTFREAEYAIRNLHDKPPLCLKVSFSTEKKSASQSERILRNQKSQEVYKNPALDHQSYETASIETMELPDYSNVLHKYNQQSKVPIDMHHTADGSLYPVPTDHYLFDPYESMKSLDYKNTLWTRDKVTVTRDGKRHVSLGRGYSLYEISESHPSTKMPITKIYEEHNHTLYEHGQDNLKLKLETCVFCKKITAVKCGKCYSFYCSKRCQVTDWPRHKTECQIPILVEDVKSLSESSNENQINVTNLNPAQKLLRRPKIKTLFNTNLESINNKCMENKKPESLMKLNESNCQVNIMNKNDKIKDIKYTLDITEKEKEVPNENTNKTDFDITRDEKNIVFPRNKSNTNNKYIENKEANENYVQANTINNTDNKIKHRECKLDVIKREVQNKYTNKNDFKIKTQEQKVFQKNTFLSTIKYTKVRILEFTQGKDFWVRKIDEENIYEQMIIDLQDMVQKMPNINPIIGNVYGYKFNNIWHRAKIISLNPTNIFFIDLGVTETVKVNEFREIKDLKNMIPFAGKICINKHALVKYENIKKNQIIAVKAMNSNENVIFVDVMNENNNTSPNETSKLESQLKVKSYTNSTHNYDNICKTISDFSLDTNGKTNKSENKKNNYSPDSSDSNTYEDKNENESNNKTKPHRLPSVINLLSKSASGFLKVNIIFHNNIYGITLRPNDLIQEFHQIITKLPEKCTSMKLNYEYKPNIGDLICGQGEISDWYRGYVVTLNPQTEFAAIDKTKIIRVQKIVPYPDEFLNICIFGVVCEINTNDIKLVTNNYYEFKVIDNENEISIEIKLDERNKVKGILKQWEPQLNQSDIQYFKLKSESKVCITFYLNHYFMFVRSLETEDLEEFNKLMQNIAKSALSAAYFQEPPVVGEIIISQYIDNNFYRAIVTKIQGEEAIVTYIDFGNSEKTSWKKLQVLPTDLKTHQSCTTKILLKDIPTNVTMTKEVSNYLIDLVGKEVPLKCKFNGIPYKDGVHLIMTNGESINDKIKQLLIPNWKIEEDKTIYTISDIDVLPLGNIGDIVKVVILNVIKDNFEYFMCLLDYELITHVHEILPKLMKEYCEHMEYYIPRVNELCLALYKDNWYRAICLSISESTDKVVLFYIDYGNCEEVLYQNIRPMTSDFLRPSSLANMCNLVNLLPEEKDGSYSPKALKRISELVKVDEVYEAKIINFDNNGNYKIELPDVRRKLIEEKLIPS